MRKRSAVKAFAVLLAACFLAGCSTVALKTTLPDGTIVELESKIFFQNREIYGESASGAWFSSKIGNKDAGVVINNAVREGAPIARDAAIGGM